MKYTEVMLHAQGHGLAKQQGGVGQGLCFSYDAILLSIPCHPLPEGLLGQRFVGFEFQCCFCIFLIITMKSPFFLIKGATHKCPFVFVSASLLGTSAGS